MSVAQLSFLLRGLGQRVFKGVGELAGGVDDGHGSGDASERAGAGEARASPKHSVAPGGRRATAFSPREWEIVVLSPPRRIAKANRVTANRLTATPAPAA